MSVGQEVLASLDEQVAELDVKIQAKREEQKQATIANMPDKYIDVLQKDIDQLVEEQKDWRRQLFALQLRIFTPQARKSSMTGRESHLSSKMPASDTKEEKVWIHHVNGKQVLFELRCHAAD